MKNLEIKATPNYSKRTFTIRKYENNRVIAKYRTNELTIEDFEELEYNTSNDWSKYLNQSQDYFSV